MQSRPAITTRKTSTGYTATLNGQSTNVAWPSALVAKAYALFCHDRKLNPGADGTTQEFDSYCLITAAQRILADHAPRKGGRGGAVA